MPRRITTLRGFLGQVLKLIPALVVVVLVLSIPVYLLLKLYFGVDLSQVAENAIADPNKVTNFLVSVVENKPTTSPLKSLLESLFAIVVFPGFTFAAIFSALFVIWVERKFVAKIQLRVGPQYAGRVEGVFQNLADILKLISKEIILPYRADKWIFVTVPLAMMFVSGALLALVPLGPNTYIANPSVGVVFIFALIGLSPVIALLAGWASNSKYSLLGGLRALHQMVAYEIPMILSALGVVVLSGSLSLVSVVEGQHSIWFILLQPLGAIVFFVAVLAELERIPFDLPEADSELVAGWQTEYSGMAFGIFQLATYIKFYALAGVFTVFYLGGWYGPGPIPAPIWFLLKTFVVMVAMMLPRAVLPRIRIDLLLRGGWTKLMVLTFANLFMAMLLVSLGIYHIGGL